jgi:tol-pal system protein YbgF
MSCVTVINSAAGADAVCEVSRQAAIAAAFVAGRGGWASPVFAQGDEVRPLLDRLDRLERDLNLLQRQVYRGKIEAGDGDLAKPPAGGAAAPAAASPNALADMEVRLSAIESELRGMTGRIEESKHAADEVRGRLDKLVADVDARLTAMEQNLAKAKAGEGAQPMAADETAPGAVPGPASAPASSPPGKGEGVLVAPPAAAPAGEGETVVAADGALLQGTPMEQYQYARAQLAKADYPGAEKTLKAFIKAYPNDELTENAEYWLGETYYVRSDYTNAAVTYAEGYKKFPGGPKAADNLLKLGLSLANLGEGEQACKAFVEIDKKFPNARGEIRDRAAAERKQRGCK